MDDAQEFNPYASPVGANLPTSRKRRGKRAAPYLSGHLYAVVLTITYCGLMVAHLANIWVNLEVAAMHRLYWNESLEYDDNAQADYFTMAEEMLVHQRQVSLVYLTAMVVNSIAYLAWVYRVYGNLRALGAKRLTQTPPGAVLWYIIPILNWFKPYQGMKEIAGGSHVDGLQAYDGLARDKTGFVAGWWAVWMTCVVVAAVASGVAVRESASADEAILKLHYDSAVHAVCVLCGIVTLYVVWTVVRMQTVRAELLETFVEAEELLPLGEVADEPEHEASDVAADEAGTREADAGDDVDWSKFNFDR